MPFERVAGEPICLAFDSLVEIYDGHLVCVAEGRMAVHLLEITSAAPDGEAGHAVCSS